MFRLVLAISALIASLAVAYYFVIFLPSKEQARQVELLKGQQAQELKEQKAKEEEKLKIAENKSLREACLTQAQTTFNKETAAFCRDASSTWSIEYMKNDCGTENAIDERLCQVIAAEIQAIDEDCQLGGTNGEEVKKKYAIAKDSCFRAYPVN